MTWRTKRRKTPTPATRTTKRRKKRTKIGSDVVTVKGEFNVTRSAIVASLFLTCFASAVLSFDKKDKEEDKLRMVQGVVMDAQENLLVGAVVQLKNSKTLQVRSFITQRKGAYQFHGLD